MADLLVFPQETVLRAIDPSEAIERVRDGFVEYAGNEWQMPPKLYLDAWPNGDFRAMPARGGELAMLKWISSFPGNPAKGLPTVIGLLVVSDATTSEPLAILDAGAVTALRTGAVAAVAAEALAGGRSCSVIGTGVNGAWPTSSACTPKRSVSVSSLKVVSITPPRVQPLSLIHI